MNLLPTNKHSNVKKNYAVVIIVFLCLHLFFTFHKNTVTNHYSFLGRSWGFNHIKYYSIAWIVVFYALALAAAIPFVNQKLMMAFRWLADVLKKMRKFRYLMFFTTGIAAAILFYIFRNKYFLLGDYTLRVNQTMNQEFVMTEFLTMKLLYYIATFLGKHNVTPVNAFVLVSCLCGGIYITVGCFIANLLGKTTLQKLLIFTAGIVSGMLLIFCGYIDIYALPLVFTIIYLYTVLLYLKRKQLFTVALLALVLAVASHLLCISFAPVLFIAWYYHNKYKLPFLASKTNKTRLWYIIALSLIAVVVAYQLKTSFVLPLKAPRGNPKYMTLFSWPHVWEFINGQLLACGASFLLLFYLLFKTIKKKMLPGIETYCFLTGTFGMMLTVFLANLHRGSGDWDIQAFTALALNITVILLLLQWQKTQADIANYFIIIIIVFNSLNAAFWIHINSSEKSLTKVEDMLTNDPGTYYTSKLPGEVQFMYILQENKLKKETEQISLKICNTSNDVRACINYGRILATENREKEAVAFYEELVQRNQFAPDAYVYLLSFYERNKQNHKVVPIVDKFYRAFKQQPDLFLSRINIAVCIGIIEYWYQCNVNNPAALADIKSVIIQLKRIEKNKATKK